MAMLVITRGYQNGVNLDPWLLLRSVQVKMECIQFLSVSPVIEMEENKQSYWKEVCKRTVEHIDKNTVSTFVGPPKFQDLFFLHIFTIPCWWQDPPTQEKCLEHQLWTRTLTKYQPSLTSIIASSTSALPFLRFFTPEGVEALQSAPELGRESGDTKKSVNMLGISWYHLRVSNNILKIHITHT